jgi:hypothetical protein
MWETPLGTSWRNKIATWAPVAVARIGKLGTRPATARELLLLALLMLALIFVSQRREIAYVVTDPGNHHKIT